VFTSMVWGRCANKLMSAKTWRGALHTVVVAVTASIDYVSCPHRKCQDALGRQGTKHLSIPGFVMFSLHCLPPHEV
jgi:hypothetical protein